jgi:hypothetical protein
MSAIPPAPPPDQERTAAAEAFYSGAVDRILRVTLVLSAFLIPVIWLRYGAVPAAGFLLGTTISYLNFHWLARATYGLASRIVETHSREKGRAVVARFLLRYLLLGLAVYVTFESWSGAVHGLLIGLCLPVAGLMAEAICEAYVALRRGL